MIATRFERALLAAAILCTAALCLAFRYLPMVDLPQHYAMVSVFVHHDDAAFGFARRYTFDLVGRPYATVYLLGAGLARLMPLGAAMRIVVAVCTVAPIAGAWALLAALRRPIFWALLAVPFAFGSLWFWGFLNFILGTGLFMVALSLVVRSTRGGSRRVAVALGALSLVVLFTHVHGVFMLLALAPPFAWAWRRPGSGWRSVVLTLVPLAPVAAATVFFVLTTWHQAVGRWPAINPGAVERMRRFADFLAAGLPDPWPIASLVALALVVALSFFVRDRGAPAPRSQSVALALALAGQVLLYFVLPLNTSTATYVSARHALLVALFTVVLLPPVEAGPRRALAVGAAATLALAGLLIAGLHLRAFDREARDFDPVLAAMKPDRRVAPLIFDKGSAVTHRATFPYLHFAAYYQAARGGDLGRSFALVWNVPVRYRPDYQHRILRDEVEWQPRLFSFSDDLPHFDYLLVRALRPVTVPPELGLTVAAEHGAWTLFENARAVQP